MKHQIYFLVVLFIAGLSLFFCLGDTRSQSPLDVPTDALDFGEVFETTSFTWKIPVHNRSSKAVHIQGFSTSCNCAAVTPSELTIGPSETQHIDLSINLSLGVPKATNNAAEVVSLTIKPNVSEPTINVRSWELRGKVKRIINLSQYEIDLGQQERKPYVPELSLRSEIDLDKLEARFLCDNWVATVIPSGDRRMFRIAISPTDNIYAGPVDCVLVLKPTSTQHLSLPDAKVLLKGLIQSNILMLPSSLMLGNQTIGSEITEVVLLKSRSAPRAVNSPRVQIDSNDTFVQIVSRPEDSVLLMTIKQKISAKGLQHRWVKLFFSEGPSEEVPVKLSISYFGE
jgi:hypothetical protein